MNIERNRRIIKGMSFGGGRERVSPKREDSMNAKIIETGGRY
jgi:hypothetical protein